jgi:hypothetical protein
VSTCDQKINSLAGMPFYILIASLLLASASAATPCSSCSTAEHDSSSLLQHRVTSETTASVESKDAAEDLDFSPESIKKRNDAQAQYCLRIQTGNGKHNDGTVNILVDSGSGLNSEASGQFYNHNDVVLEKCYSNDIESVQVKNPTNNAWIGSIEYSSDGNVTYRAMSCTGCTLCMKTHQIVVDGNSDSGGLAEAQCLGGVECLITQARYVVRIQTGTSEHNDGTLDVSVDSGTGSGLEPLASGRSYASGAVVLQQCYSNDIASLQVKNPTNNAWTGAVEYSSDGGETYLPMECANCGCDRPWYEAGLGRCSPGATSQMVVDGNSDSGDQAQTKCLNGVACNITQATCASYSCPSDFSVKNKTSTTLTDSNCCQANVAASFDPDFFNTTPDFSNTTDIIAQYNCLTQQMYGCLPGYLLNVTASNCCSPTCALYPCPPDYLMEKNMSTIYTESNCCQAPR